MAARPPLIQFNFTDMKYLFLSLACCAGLNLASAQKKQFNDTAYLQPVEVQAVKAADNAPFAKNNISRAEIVKTNLGQDLPFVLNQLPGVVVNSDAGNGVGYTGIRIRGTDASRINVTINGIHAIEHKMWVHLCSKCLHFCFGSHSFDFRTLAFFF